MNFSEDIQSEYFMDISIIVTKIQNEIKKMEKHIIRSNTPKQKFSCYILQREFGSQRPYTEFCLRMNFSGAFDENRVFGYSSYRVFIGTRNGSLDIQNTLLIIVMLALSLDEAIYFALLHNHNFFIPEDITVPRYFDFLNEICSVLPRLESPEKRFEYAEIIRKTKYKNIPKVN